MQTLIQELRLGPRTLLKRPGFTFITAQWQVMLALLLSLLIVKTAPAQQKAGDLKLEAYALETPDKQKLTAELGKVRHEVMETTVACRMTTQPGILLSV
ncbi:MAG TPA: hypothetical protein VG324_24345, partial [Blastocatellia bacterium]|nr:hypothetical protein [Blastocatellia bacterium]